MTNMTRGLDEAARTEEVYLDPGCHGFIDIQCV